MFHSSSKLGVYRAFPPLWAWTTGAGRPASSAQRAENTLVTQTWHHADRKEVRALFSHPCLDLGSVMHP